MSPIRTNRALQVVIGAASLLLLGAAPNRSVVISKSGSISWARSASDPRWVIGHVSVGSAPFRVLERLEDVENWSDLIPDLTAVSVEKHDQNYWKISTVSQSIDCGAFEAHIVFVKANQVTMAMDIPDVQANWQLKVAQGPHEGTANLTLGVFMTPAEDSEEGWYGTPENLRKIQEVFTQRHLENLEQALNPLPPSII